jgi:hypothetical protein
MGQKDKILRFCHEIPTLLSPKELWNQLELAMTDSDKSPIWPHDLESIKSNGLIADGLVTATYFSIFGSDTKKYRFIEVDPYRSFTYSPQPPHAFSGVIKVSLIEEPKGAKLIWKGEYHYSGFPLAYWYFKLFFEKRFFSSLERNLSRFSVK